VKRQQKRHYRFVYNDQWGMKVKQYDWVFSVVLSAGLGITRSILKKIPQIWTIFVIFNLFKTKWLQTSLYFYEKGARFKKVGTYAPGCHCPSPFALLWRPCRCFGSECCIVASQWQYRAWILSMHPPLFKDQHKDR